MKKYLIFIIFLLIPVQCFGDSFEKTKKLAISGDLNAQYRLGEMYHRGEGVIRDKKESTKWFMKSAEQGNPDGQAELGAMYWDGYGVKKNYTESIKWFLKSAEQGHAGAQMLLGSIYNNGEGVTLDHKEAFKWYKNQLNKEILSLKVPLLICTVVVLELHRIMKKVLNGTKN